MIDKSTAVNEFNLFAVVAKHDDPSQDIIRRRIITEERW